MWCLLSSPDEAHKLKNTVSEAGKQLKAVREDLKAVQVVVLF